MEGVRDDSPGIEHDFALAEFLDQMRVVRGDHHGHADFLETLEYAHDFHAQTRIEIARGLIGDQQLRLADDGARDADALLLAHRKLERRGALPA